MKKCLLFIASLALVPDAAFAAQPLVIGGMTVRIEPELKSVPEAPAWARFKVPPNFPEVNVDAKGRTAFVLPDQKSGLEEALRTRALSLNKSFGKELFGENVNTTVRIRSRGIFFHVNTTF